jgi:hypothetical protein
MLVRKKDSQVVVTKLSILTRVKQFANSDCLSSKNCPMKSVFNKFRLWIGLTDFNRHLRSLDRHPVSSTKKTVKLRKALGRRVPQ